MCVWIHTHTLTHAHREYTLVNIYIYIYIYIETKTSAEVKGFHGQLNPTRHSQTQILELKKKNSQPS